jgi:hypothetical protein
MDDVVFDKRDQLEKIEAALLPGEEIKAVFDLKGGGTGFLEITAKRVIFQDNNFLRRMKALVSIPYRAFTPSRLRMTLECLRAGGSSPAVR